MVRKPASRAFSQNDRLCGRICAAPTLTGGCPVVLHAIGTRKHQTQHMGSRIEHTFSGTYRAAPCVNAVGQLSRGALSLAGPTTKLALSPHESAELDATWPVCPQMRAPNAQHATLNVATQWILRGTLLQLPRLGAEAGLTSSRQGYTTRLLCTLSRIWDRCCYGEGSGTVLCDALAVGTDGEGSAVLGCTGRPCSKPLLRCSAAAGCAGSAWKFRDLLGREAVLTFSKRSHARSRCPVAATISGY